jgi:aspartate kinase
MTSANRASHTVEKIGGTTMSWDGVVDGVLLGGRPAAECYGRIFVVSAYARITDLLLENKRSPEQGVFGLFRDAVAARGWSEALTAVAERMHAINARVLEDAADRARADTFVTERIDGVRRCLFDLARLCRHGYFELDAQLPTVRELLASVGEAHSANNATLLLRRRGVEAIFVDLTGWGDQDPAPLDDVIRDQCAALDLTRTLPVVAGYVRCSEGLVATFQRGYTEITFSRIAAQTRAREAIIHKEYHLSSADPRIVGAERALPIGRTNYDVADQLSLLGMEAVHPGAARALRRAGIPLRVKRALEPEHAGTLIEADYRSDVPCVEIIAGMREVYAFEVFDHEMLERRGHQLAIQRLLDLHRVGIVARESNANTITHFLACDGRLIDRLRADIETSFPDATVRVQHVAVVSAIGSDLDVPGLLASCVGALAEAEIPILAIFQSIRTVDIKFVVRDEDYEQAVVRLHRRVVERDACGVRRVA